MTKTHLRLAGLSAAALFVAGCSGQASVDTTHLTIVTSSAALDHATSMAVAEYIQHQGVEVEIQHHTEHAEVLAALETPTPEDRAVLGILTRPQEAGTEERMVALPEAVEVVAQAPAELGFVPTASTITAAEFAQEVSEAEDPEAPLATACEGQTWSHPQLGEDQLETISEALAQQGCEPEFEVVDALDTETYGALIEQLIVEPDTVVMLRSLDPAITDQGLATLDVETQQWPNSNIVAISGMDLDATLTDHVSEVIDVVDSDAATTLLRGYHNAQTSVSDLHYEVDDAVRYWLADVGLIEPDAVTNVTDGNH